MKGLYLGLVFLVSVVVWRAEFVSSAVIDPNNGRGSPLGKVDPQDSIKTIENAMTEYVVRFDMVLKDLAAISFRIICTTACC
jgi:hypothetical protein